MPTVSLIIPTYNRAAAVRRAIDSALHQTRIPDEIIVVDDGSTDHTREVLAGYGSSIIVLGDGMNRERSGARNIGLETATGDYIAFLDSDDTLPPESVEKRLNALEEHSEYNVVYTDAHFVSEAGIPVTRFSAVQHQPEVFGNAFYPLILANFAPIHAYMFRKTQETASARMDETIHTLEDHDFWLQLACDNKFMYLKEPLANYHLHQGMTTRTENEAMRRGRLIVQGRWIASPQFAALSLWQQSDVLTQYGASYAAILGDMPEARAHLAQAFRLNPRHFQATFYWFLTWLGGRGVNHLNTLRRSVKRRMRPAVFQTD